MPPVSVMRRSPATSNVLGEGIDRVEGVCDLADADLRGRRWSSVDLGGLSLWGANLEGANLISARLVHASSYNANLSGVDIFYAYA